MPYSSSQPFRIVSGRNCGPLKQHSQGIDWLRKTKEHQPAPLQVLITTSIKTSSPSAEETSDTGSLLVASAAIKLNEEQITRATKNFPV